MANEMGGTTEPSGGGSIQIDVALNSSGSGRTQYTLNDADGPDGTTTAEKLETNTTENNSYWDAHVESASLAASTTYYLSFFCKASDYDYAMLIAPISDLGTAYERVFFDLTGGGSVGSSGGGFDGSAGVVDYGNGWVRCWATFESNASGSLTAGIGPANADGAYIFTPASSGLGIHVWGAWLDTVNYTDTNTTQYLVASDTASDGTTSATFTANLPDTIAANDVLVLISCGPVGTRTITSVQDSTSDNWTQKYYSGSGSGYAVYGLVYAKLADGDEDGGTVTVTLSGTSFAHSWAVFNLGPLTNGLASLEVNTAASYGTSGTPEYTGDWSFNSASPSWGTSASTLYVGIAFAGQDGELVDAWPANATNMKVQTSSGAGTNTESTLALAMEEQTSASLTINDVSWDVNAAGAALVLMVEGASNQSPVPVLLAHYMES